MPAWKAILVHHSAGHDDATSNFEEIKRIHVQERGWKDIGYHAVVESVNGVSSHRAGRPETMVGSHCPGQNAIALGVCVVGNFETETPDAAHLEALIDQLVIWCAKYNIKPDAISGHRDHKATLCPGRTLYAKLPWLREQVAERLDD